MTVENAIMRLSDRIMEQEELTKLIGKEIKYEISDSAKNSVIATVDFLTDKIETQRNFKRIRLVASTISVWFVNVWISKTMFFHHVI